ncbi:hypothetical protein PLICRDRAFT_588854 [Plicaturopsis crispa FD-325 SS-3]|nr:hypothetical protein PLICRDRAFT_588854 [Plicaturopsis crispa FD-325 SS-3]
MASTSTSSVPVYMLPGVTPVQPSHLEGDPSLATEILPGPPSLVFAQQSSHKREPKKLTAPVSYLPTSDPGSTYSGLMAGSAMGSLEVEGPRRKRARVDKGTAAGRAQRAQARNMNGAPPASDPPPASEASESLPAPIPDSDPIPMQVDSDPPPPPTTATSRSASASASTVKVEDAPLPRGPGRPKGSTKDKGKAKATDGDRSHSRAKEDAVAETSYSPAPALGLNEDHCSACRSLGSLVYCDGCPRAYHLWCLDPPMDAIEDATWFCPSCTILHQAQTSAPMEYQLPDEIRGFFKDVSTGPRGSYVDSSEIKQPRLNRHGQLEERDPHRLRDRNGAPVLCFKCETTALPEGLPAAKRSHRSSPGSSSSDKWRSIVSCDYCGLHWHLDCLDPPLPSMPTFGKKWMCPNHADQILKPKRRIPKQNAPPIEIDKPNQFNNGNIEVIQSQTLAANEIKPVAVDEVFINGRRYRVPERVITLDFWNKVRRQRHHTDEDVVPSHVSELSRGRSAPDFRTI